MLIKTDVNLADKSVLWNKNWNQSPSVHLVEYGVVKIMCGHHFLPLCIFHYVITHYIFLKMNSYIYHSLQCVWNMNPVGPQHFLHGDTSKIANFFTILCTSHWAIPPPDPLLTHLTYWVINLIIFILLIWKFVYLKEYKIIYEGHSVNSEVRCVSAIAYLLAESWCCLYKAPTFISHNTKETIS